MRKILSFFAFVAIVISFAACGGNDGNVPEVKGFTFKVQALSTKAHVIVTPDIPNKAYFWWREKASVIDDKQMSLRQYVEDFLSTKTYDQWDGIYILTEPQDYYLNYLDADSKYIIYAFYIEKVGEDAKIVGNIESYEFTTMPEYTLNGEFTVDAQGKKVRFMQANMQQASSFSGLSFMTNQWDCVGSNSSYPRDLFTWDQAANALPSTVPYHLLPANEWAYLFRERPNAERLFAHATLTIGGNDTKGIILLPDNWEKPDDIQLTTDFEMEMLWDEQEEKYIKEGLDGYSVNNFDKDEWESLEFAGAVFLPAAGANGINRNTYGNYWSSTPSGETSAHRFSFGSYNISLSCLYEWSTARTHCQSIRPVREIK